MRGAKLLALGLAGCGRLNFDPDSRDAAPAVDRGLLLHVDFEDGFVDTVGGRPVTCLGTCPSIVPGPLGMAASLFSDDCLVIEDDPALQSPTYSFSAWFNPHTGNEVENLLGRTLDSETGGANTFELGYETGELAVYGGGVSVRVPAALDTWHHAAGVLTGTRLRGYLDGVKFGEVAATPQLVAGQAFRIGCDRDNATDLFFLDAELDDIRLYGRELDDAEIAALAALPFFLGQQPQPLVGQQPQTPDGGNSPNPWWGNSPKP